MVNIIVVFSSQKDGINIRNLLMRHGHNVVTVCTNGAAVSQAVDQMEGSDGIVVLMETKNMSEVEAHRYIQKCSMDNGSNMVETAQMVIEIYSQV